MKKVPKAGESGFTPGFVQRVVTSSLSGRHIDPILHMSGYLRLPALTFPNASSSFVAHFVVGSLLPTHVPVSPFAHPPVAAAYEPFAAEPLFVTLPVKTTF